MEGTELVNITVLIAGRSYPLKVKQEDVNKIRAIADEVNEKIDNFRKMYSRMDKQDYLSMALLTYAVDFHKSQQIPENTIPKTDLIHIADKVEKLDELLDFLLE